MARPLHIALVSAFPPGRQSLNEYGLHLANGFAQRKDVAKVTVIADKIDDHESELELDPKISVIRAWDFNSAATAFKIDTILKRLAPDGAIWNIQTASFGDREIPAALGLLGPMFARRLNLPCGVIAHNIIAGIDLDSTQLKGAFFRQRLIRAGGSLVTSALMAAHYCTVTLRGYQETLAKNHPKANVHLVPHGTFETEKTAPLSLHDRPNRIVTMGKFGTYKRLETLLDAFGILRKDGKHGDLTLEIGGTDHPNAQGYISGLKERHSDDPGISFRGYIPEEDIQQFFEQARLSVFDYSSTTGSSGVLHQTASYGTVPVFPRIGDFVDLCLDEGLTGAHYSPGDPHQMADAISRMLGDLDHAQSIADRNLAAAGNMPFSDVINFHMKQVRSLRNDRDRTWKPKADTTYTNV